METLAELLEHELEDAFQVKNRESLQRYVRLLTENYLKKETYHYSREEDNREHQKTRNEVRIVAVQIQEMNKRLEMTDKQFNKRFDDQKEYFDRRFNEQKDFFDKRFIEQKEASERRFEQINKRFTDQKESTDKHFEQVDKRFEQVDKRFDQVDKRFNRLFLFLSLGFTAITGLMTLYQFIH